ncbi:MAG: hypothetical protein AYK19_03525 [Theionarchaea archaeon DG-70-1]|nr:MAG: hypothetical protein AYK19_03525 [Theionarchaea archaeon DG-70-1]
MKEIAGDLVEIVRTSCRSDNTVQTAAVCLTLPVFNLMPNVIILFQNQSTRMFIGQGSSHVVTVSA